MCYDFKDSLASIPIHLTSLETDKREHVFSTNSPTGGGMHIILFVSLIISNRTVVLDAAVIPPSLASSLLQLITRRRNKAKGAELRL
jgi:hypothetical protein